MSRLIIPGLPPLREAAPVSALPEELVALDPGQAVAVLITALCMVTGRRAIFHSCGDAGLVSHAELVGQFREQGALLLKLLPNPPAGAFAARPPDKDGTQKTIGRIPPRADVVTPYVVPGFNVSVHQGAAKRLAEDIVASHLMPPGSILLGLAKVIMVMAASSVYQGEAQGDEAGEDND